MQQAYNERRQRTNSDSVDEGGEQSGSEEMKTRQVWQLGQRYRRQCVFHDTAICREACQHCHYQAPPLISRVIFLPFFAFAMISHGPQHHVLLTYYDPRQRLHIRGISSQLTTPTSGFMLDSHCEAATQLLLKRLMLTPFDYANTLVASRAFNLSLTTSSLTISNSRGSYKHCVTTLFPCTPQ